MRPLLLFAALSLSAASASAQPAEPEARTYRVAGGDSLTAFVFASQTDAPAPAILLFHGGGWSHGRPQWTFGAARRFAARGMTAVAVEYRLSRDETTPIEALDDVCTAFRWVREQADALGVDPDRVAGYGVSAGGHLVASTVTLGCPDASGVAVRGTPDALLLWSPALDMERDGWFERKLQGRASAAEYSPLVHAGAHTPPTSIVHGEEDTLTPWAGARAFCERLRAHDVGCDVHAYPGVGHLLTRNLEQQERDFDPDPDAVADGVARHLAFLESQGFIAPE